MAQAGIGFTTTYKNAGTKVGNSKILGPSRRPLRTPKPKLSPSGEQQFVGLREQADRETSFAGSSPQRLGVVPSNEDPQLSQIRAHPIAGLQECETTRPRSRNCATIRTVIGLSGLTGAILANPLEWFQGGDTEIG